MSLNPALAFRCSSHFRTRALCARGEPLADTEVRLVPAGSAIPQGDESWPGCLGLRTQPQYLQSLQPRRGVSVTRRLCHAASCWRRMPTIDSRTSTLAAAASLLAGQKNPTKQPIFNHPFIHFHALLIPKLSSSHRVKAG